MKSKLKVRFPLTKLSIIFLAFFLEGWEKEAFVTSVTFPVWHINIWIKVFIVMGMILALSLIYPCKRLRALSAILFIITSIIMGSHFTYNGSPPIEINLTLPFLIPGLQLTSCAAKSIYDEEKISNYYAKLSNIPDLRINYYGFPWHIPNARLSDGEYAALCSSRQGLFETLFITASKHSFVER